MQNVIFSQHSQHCTPMWHQSASRRRRTALVGCSWHSRRSWQQRAACCDARHGGRRRPCRAPRSCENHGWWGQVRGHLTFTRHSCLCPCMTHSCERILQPSCWMDALPKAACPCWCASTGRPDVAASVCRRSGAEPAGRCCPLTARPRCCTPASTRAITAPTAASAAPRRDGSRPHRTSCSSAGDPQSLAA